MKINAFPILVQQDKNGKHSKKPKVKDPNNHMMDIDDIDNYKYVGLRIPKNHVLIDLDFYKDKNLLNKINPLFNPPPDWTAALLQTTISGGKHYVFKLPDGVVVKQGVNLAGIVGFDVRTHESNGWIATGRGYEDATFLGVAQALNANIWPELPTVPDGLTKPATAGKVVADFDALVDAQPLGITKDQIEQYLNKISDCVDAYEPWLKVGMALYHEYQGSDEGLKAWVKWSEQSKHFDLDEIERKWPTFGRTGGECVTFRSIIKMAKDAGYSNLDAAVDIIDRTEEINNKTIIHVTEEIRVLSLNLTKLEKEILANYIRNKGGKTLGITKSAIIKDITPARRPKYDLGNNWVADWVYLEELDRFINIENNSLIGRSAFNFKFRDEVELDDRPADIVARDDHGIPCIANMMYYPGEDLFFEFENKRLLNLYRFDGPDLVDEYSDRDKATIEIVLSHFEFLLGKDSKEFQIFMNWIAYHVQYPGAKINWVILLEGPQGVGKTFIQILLAAILGPRNVRSVASSQLSSRFNSGLTLAQINVIEEVRLHGRNKFEIMDMLKALITNPRVQTEGKGRDAVEVHNPTNYLLLTNERNAIPLDYEDRRYCVMACQYRTKDAFIDVLGGEVEKNKYFERLYRAVDDHAGALRTFFNNLAISSAFYPKGNAPETQAGLDLQRLSKPDWLEDLEMAIETHYCRGVIDEDVVVTTHLNRLVEWETGKPIVGWQMRDGLIKLGYKKTDGLIRVGENRYNVWIRIGFDGDYKESIKQNLK
ncbi:MAG: PriCT-2 domain-containing protein [Methylomicrobium sp.]|nr:PriCT-2 domain-containing protein [Methylomicrobium sp.]